MYVSYLLEKDPGMNGTAGRHHNLNFNHQNFLPAPQQYTDYSAYHHIPAFHGGDPNHGNLSAGAWNATYPPPREDWSAFCHGAGPLGSNLGPVSLNLRDLSPIVPPEQSLVQSVVTASTAGQLSPDPQRTDPYQWMRKNTAPGNTGKTRTKDKYRVVYSEHQRVELEKEFHYSRYITIRRKAELALGLSLSERQVGPPLSQSHGRARPGPQPIRETGEDLVPESPGEGEENDETHEGAATTAGLHLYTPIT
ncbi:hypothetical protein AALO_G00190240 [Alosa alosa]|uniref:Homeobox domain-containing protein n=1 Tax=Alosa alosa TaxID=278164 RepID=A0AAV6G9Z3_9TELE|nr:hypothetical protein AALO_G00190240 [Alosa alosa]